MGSGGVNLTGKQKPEEQAKNLELRYQTNRLHNAMISESARNEVGSKQRFADLKVQLAKAESDLQSFQNSLYNRYPDVQRKRVAKTVTLSEVGKYLPADTGLLEYITLSAKSG